MASRLIHPPITLWKFLTADLWKRILLTAAILVTVIAFAAAIQPLADGQVGAIDALRFMGLAIVPMLQFALPFAAGFAATLTYHDFAADNEAMACSAGGITYKALLGPATITGLVLAAVIYLLTTTLIPRFFAQIEQLIARDIARLLTTSIERGDSVTLKDLTIHADNVANLGPDAQIGATDRLVLQGVVAVATDKAGNIEVDVTAKRADVWLFRADQDNQPETRIVMQLTDAHGKQAGAGSVDLSQHQLGPWSMPSGVRDRIKTRTAGELRRLYRDPDLRPSIDQRRRELAAQLSARILEAELAEAAARDQRITLVSPESRVDLITAGLVRDGPRWSVVPQVPGEPIEIIWREQDDGIRRQLAGAAALEIAVDPQSAKSKITLLLEQVRFADAQGEALRESVTRSELTATIEVPTPFFEQPSAALLGAADNLMHSAPNDPAINPIKTQARKLRKNIVRVRHEIIGHQQERFALSAATLIMTILGAILALKLKDSLPLTVYLWSFFPALLALITISGGSNAATDNLILGVTVIWAGVGALALLTLREFVTLRRH